MENRSRHWPEALEPNGMWLSGARWIRRSKSKVAFDGWVGVVWGSWRSGRSGGPVVGADRQWGRATLLMGLEVERKESKTPGHSGEDGTDTRRRCYLPPQWYLMVNHKSASALKPHSRLLPFAAILPASGRHRHRHRLWGGSG